MCDKYYNIFHGLLLFSGSHGSKDDDEKKVSQQPSLLPASSPVVDTPEPAIEDILDQDDVVSMETILDL